MKNNQKIVIGDRILTKKELFEEEEFRKERAKLSFEEKIRQLIELQKLASSWGNKKNLIVWKVS